MLYVFHVDSGRMLKFEMSHTVWTVERFKEYIERQHGLPASSQVLLVSGGEILLPGALVSSYPAGTDTNPIYMFTTLDSSNPPQPWPSIEQDIDITEQINQSLALPATYSTVIARASLAKKIYEISQDEEVRCSKYVHEQHLQQQGWSAVCANLEDLAEEFRLRFENFSKSFNGFLAKQDEYIELLTQFNYDVDNLGRIPILPSLLKNAEEFPGFEEYITCNESGALVQSINQPNISSTLEEITSDNNEGDECKQIVSQQNRFITLLQWISSKENQRNLTTMAEECIRGLKLLDKFKIEHIKAEALNIIETAQKPDIKKIKGLEDRLCGLDQLMFKFKKMVQEQKEISAAFQQVIKRHKNQERASNLRDNSILPDLCASHRSQLSVMLGNHNQIRDFRRRITNAKDELGSNLNTRLKFIVHIENTMSELDNNLLFYHRCLRRVERHVNILQQIHLTPNIYVRAVTEVVRRKIYSNAFNMWASNLAGDILAIRNEEINRRQEFNNLFEGHFLSSLFPGMTDMPPLFATEAPTTFDSSLPNITKNDIEMLTSYLPDLTAESKLPDMGPVIEFFSLRSIGKNFQNSLSGGKLQLLGAAEPYPHRPNDFLAHLKDEFESETDTEEFEKIGRLFNDIQGGVNSGKEFISVGTMTGPAITCTVETWTEENLGSTTLEVERLQSLLKKMSKISLETLKLLKYHLNLVKEQSSSDCNEMNNKIKKLAETWSLIKVEYDCREKEVFKNIFRTHELEKIDLSKKLLSKEDEIQSLIDKMESMEASHKETISNLKKENSDISSKFMELKQSFENLENEYKNVELVKEKAVNECRERLIHDHKTEIESLRCRFKLMTSMDRSPSDSSLEKIERPDMIDLASHESILNQTKEELKTEKELAIKIAVEKERQRLSSENSLHKLKPLRNNIFKRIIEEKEKQIDNFRERNLILTRENSNLKMKIGNLVCKDEKDYTWLNDKIEALSKEKEKLEKELMIEKNRKLEMESSFSLVKGSIVSRDFGQASPDINQISKSKMNMSTPSLIKQGIMFESCSKGDIVLVVWNKKHGQYIIAQESATIYFLHGDSLSKLNLKHPANAETTLPETLFCIGRVIDKEYCHARKDENRYKVTKGTKFYRVWVQPLFKPELNRQKRERFASTGSEYRSTSTQRLIDSFAQTDDSGIIVSSRDMVDSSSSKFRTNSITEEDDEPSSLLSKRCRYISVSEEEEKNLSDDSDMKQDCHNTSLHLPTESPSEKDQDDSDEYRSLEAKDDLYFQ